MKFQTLEQLWLACILRKCLIHVGNGTEYSYSCSHSQYTVYGAYHSSMSCVNVSSSFPPMPRQIDVWTVSNLTFVLLPDTYSESASNYYTQRQKFPSLQTRLLQFPPLQYRKQGHSQTSACPKLFSKGSHAFSTFFSLSAASKITALATCALSHHFQNVYNSLSSTLIYTTSISKFNANSNKKFQTATLNQ